VSLRNGLRNLWNDLNRLWADPVAGGVIAAGFVYVFSLTWPSVRAMLVTSLGAFGITAIGVLLLVTLVWRYSRPAPKILVFLSSGGTCRDPMAKAITIKLFESRKPGYRVVIRGAGLGPIRRNEAAYAARSVIREMYDGQDLLARHKPELLTKKLADEADLILAMDESLLKARKTSPDGWPYAYEGKLYLLKEFFGLEGNVSDPWPDGRDAVTLQKYRDCAKELAEILDARFARLIEGLQA
jgi:protein-tyrosine-phosphatase